MQIEGVWHTSIVVGGLEYYFGCGVSQSSPGLTPFGRPVQVIELGYDPRCPSHRQNSCQMYCKCRAGTFPHYTHLACPIRPVLFCRSTRIPRDSRNEYLQSLRMTYTATAYSLFHRNCNNFSNDFSNFLTGSGIPVRIPPAVHSSPTLLFRVVLRQMIICDSVLIRVCTLMCCVHCSDHTVMAICCRRLEVRLALYGIHLFKFVCFK